MANEIERVHYFDYQFLRKEDFTDEQNYHIQMRKLQNKHMFSSGIVNGLEVRTRTESGKPSVIVAPGMAIDGEGRAIIVSEDLTHELPEGTPEYVYLTLAEDKKTDSREQIVRIVQRPQVTTDGGAGGIRLARLTWTGRTLESPDLSARERASARGVDLQPFLKNTRGTVTERLNVGGERPGEAVLRAEDAHVRFFVKGDVAIEGNLYVSTKLFTPGGGINDLSPGGGDLAEVYASHLPLEPGEVVCLHPDDDTIVRATVPNDPLVFGVISTAPAHVLGKANGLGFPVALTGRVPCKVVAENGPIQRGDL